MHHAQFKEIAPNLLQDLGYPDILEDGDLEEAMNAARQIGDDMLQRNAGRVPMPHTMRKNPSSLRILGVQRKGLWLKATPASVGKK